MKKITILLALAFFSLFTLTNCTKAVEAIVGFNNPQPGHFFEYRIRQGNHSADFSAYIPVHSDVMNFMVRFDSTAIYQTSDPINQYDINKLYGFSDNSAQHHEYSARFGWNWNHGSLHLYAYVYNDGVLQTEEITVISVGAEYQCSIRVTSDQYQFSVNNSTVSLPRSATTHSGDGYKLYPYFGGDETAPHDIRIWIKEL